MKRYNPKEIEPRWQKAWTETGLYKAIDFDKRPKYVMLTEFPYPSGAGIHIGHSREYTLGDVLARHKRMQGYNVLFPMGYDAFGLPTENYAIKNKVSPQKATDDNVATFQKQLEALGFSFDWSRSFRTTDPTYYKWTQWLFLQFFKNGLAYQAEIAINWCPFCKTGLANEEVVNGRHERCDTPVEKKFLKQWLLKITAYADRLINGLADVDYPSRIADQQINWIGRSKGAEVDFVVDGTDEKLTVFTTRPDTIYGVTFMVLAPEHPLLRTIVTEEQKNHVGNCIKAAQSKTDLEREEEAGREKTGVFTGAYAVNPISHQKIPIWASDYVLIGYGAGAIMAVPAHDERDWEFASKFNLPVRPVIIPQTGIASSFVMGQKNITPTDIAGVGGNIESVTGSGVLCVTFPIVQAAAFERLIVDKMEPGFWNEYISDEDVIFIFKHPDGSTERLVLNDKNEPHIRNLGHKFNHQAETDESVWEWLGNNSFYVRLFLNCHEGKVVNSGSYNGINASDMREQVVADLVASGYGREQVHYKLRDWIFSRQHYWGEPIPIIHCPEHGAVAVPDNQLPVELPLVDYYEPTDNGESPLSAIESWVNTACPTCGQPAKRETDTMPNWAGSSWYYLRYFDPHNTAVFADRSKLDYWGAVDMYLGGMEHTTLHLLYSRFWHQFFYDQGLVPTPEPYMARRGQGIILAADGAKMSKSRGNVIDPIDVIDSGYGADALRVAVAFIAPYDQTTPWSPEGVAGTYRFLNRVWILTQEFMDSTASGTGEQGAHEKDILQIIHRLIKKVSDDLAGLNFNTAIAAQMEAVNELYKLKEQDHFVSQEAWKFAVDNLLMLLAPFAPHITEELWQQLGHEGSIHTSQWPSHDDKYLTSETVTVVVQVNGKLRAQLELPADVSESQAVEAAKVDSKIVEYLADKEAKRTIYIPGRLINFVI